MSSQHSWNVGKRIFNKLFGSYFKTDETIGAQAVLSTTEYEAHNGNSYFLKTYVFDEGTTGNNTFFSFDTPVGTHIHAKAIIAPDVDYTVAIYESGSTTGGTATAGVNNLRSSSKVASLMPMADPTIVDSGTAIWQARTGGGKNPVGVSPGFNYEIITKEDTTYIFKITKNIAQAGVVDVDFFWLERT